jgi:hypothetical protein
MGRLGNQNGRLRDSISMIFCDGSKKKRKGEGEEEEGFVVVGGGE